MIFGNDVLRSKKQRENYERKNIDHYLKGEGIISRLGSVELQRKPIPKDIRKHVEKTVGVTLDAGDISMYSYAPRSMKHLSLEGKKTKKWGGSNTLIFWKKPLFEKKQAVSGTILLPQSAMNDAAVRDALIVNELASIAAAKKLTAEGKQYTGPEVPTICNKAESSYLRKKHHTTRKKVRKKATQLFHDIRNWSEKKSPNNPRKISWIS